VSANQPASTQATMPQQVRNFQTKPLEPGRLPHQSVLLTQQQQNFHLLFSFLYAPWQLRTRVKQIGQASSSHQFASICGRAAYRLSLVATILLGSTNLLYATAYHILDWQTVVLAAMLLALALLSRHRNPATRAAAWLLGATDLVSNFALTTLLGSLAAYTARRLDDLFDTFVYWPLTAAYTGLFGVAVAFTLLLNGSRYFRQDAYVTFLRSLGFLISTITAAAILGSGQGFTPATLRPNVLYGVLLLVGSAVLPGWRPATVMNKLRQPLGCKLLTHSTMCGFCFAP